MIMAIAAAIFVRLIFNPEYALIFRNDSDRDYHYQLKLNTLGLDANLCQENNASIFSGKHQRGHA